MWYYCLATQTIANCADGKTDNPPMQCSQCGANQILSNDLLACLGLYNYNSAYYV